MIRSDFHVRFRRAELDAALRGLDRYEAAVLRGHLNDPGAQVLAGIAFQLGAALGRGERRVSHTSQEAMLDASEVHAIVASGIDLTTHPWAWRAFKESMQSAPAMSLMRAAWIEGAQLAADDVDASLEELAARSRRAVER